MRTALEARPVCCSGPREFPFESAALEQRYAFTIDESSPAFAFPTGKSYFKGFALPASPKPMAATIVSYAVVEKASLNKWTGHYFSPIVVFYDENLRPSRQLEGIRKFLFDGQGRRFSAFQVPVAPDARFMVIYADAHHLNTKFQVPVEFATRDTEAIVCGAPSESLYAGRPDMALLAKAMCGLFTETTVYVPPQTWEWHASVPYSPGGELVLWLMPPDSKEGLPSATR